MIPYHRQFDKKFKDQKDEIDEISTSEVTTKSEEIEDIMNDTSDLLKVIIDGSIHDETNGYKVYLFKSDYRKDKSEGKTKYNKISFIKFKE